MRLILFRCNKKILAIAGIAALALIGGGLWWWIYYTNTISTDDARVKGTIVAVSSRLSACVAELLVDEGDIVEAGQVIARLDRRELEIQVAKAKANLALATAKLSGIKAGNRPQQIAQATAKADSALAQLNRVQNEYERTAALYSQGALSAQQMDVAQAALTVAKAQYAEASQSVSLTVEGSRTEDIEAAMAEVEQADASLKNALLQLDNTTIVAPISGIIALRSVNVGESTTVGQTIFNIVDSNNVWIAANIEETYVGKIRVGQSVTFSLDAFPRKRFSGKVCEVGAATKSQFSLLPNENTSGNYTKLTQKLPVKIAIADTNQEKLKPGMSAVICIDILSC